MTCCTRWIDSMMQTESSRYSSTTQTTVSPRKRTTETQTLKKRKRAKKQSASVTVSSATVTSAVMVDADVDVDFDLGVIAKDRPLWTASSTQTRHVTYMVRRKFDSKVA